MLKNDDIEKINRINIQAMREHQTMLEKIANEISNRKDSAVAMSFTEQICKLLKDNGVVPHLAEFDLSSEKQNSYMVEYGVLVDRLDFSEHDKVFCDEIQKLKEQMRGMVVLPGNPIEAASVIIDDLFCDTKKLRQIAEHLLVYCNNNAD